MSNVVDLIENRMDQMLEEHMAELLRRMELYMEAFGHPPSKRIMLDTLVDIAWPDAMPDEIEWSRTPEGTLRVRRRKVQ